MFVIFCQPQSPRSFNWDKCLLLHSILSSIIPKLDDNLPFGIGIYCLQSISSTKLRRNLFPLAKASFSFHFLPDLFDFWQKNGETLSRNVFVEPGGGCSGSSVPPAPDEASDRPAGGLSQHVNSPSAFLDIMIICMISPRSFTPILLQNVNSPSPSLYIF